MAPEAAPRTDTAPGLRERKRARTRQDILAAFLAELEDSPIDGITVDRVCARAGYSRATFFTYFGSKEAVLDYFVHGWCHTRTVEQVSGEFRGRAGIERIFTSAAEHPACLRLLVALVHYYSGLSGPPPAPSLEAPELANLHPRSAEFPGLPRRDLCALIGAYLVQESRHGDPETLAGLLVAAFYALPLQLQMTGAPPAALGPAYARAITALLD